jgi:hypothetical protein
MGYFILYAVRCGHRCGYVFWRTMVGAKIKSRPHYLGLRFAADCFDGGFLCFGK